MIPALVAAEIRETVLDYLQTTWSLADRELEAALFRFLEGALFDQISAQWSRT